MDKVKLIGIVATPINKSDRMGLNKVYIEYFKKFGSVILIDATSDYLHTNLDLLVIPGGADVDTARYDEKPGFYTQRPNIYAEWFDNNMYDQYVEAGVPIFGICRGLQTTAVKFGAKLGQHIYQEYSSKHRGELVDKILLDLDTLKALGIEIPRRLGLDKKTKEKYIEVNSLHHQGLMLRDVEDKNLPLHYVGINKDYPSNIEAIVHKSLPIAAVQWHPEELDSSQFSDNLINWLMDYKENSKTVINESQNQATV